MHIILTNEMGQKKYQQLSSNRQMYQIWIEIEFVHCKFPPGKECKLIYNSSNKIRELSMYFEFIYNANAQLIFDENSIVIVGDSWSLTQKSESDTVFRWSNCTIFSLPNATMRWLLNVFIGHTIPYVWLVCLPSVDFLAFHHIEQRKQQRKSTRKNVDK